MKLKMPRVQCPPCWPLICTVTILLCCVVLQLDQYQVFTKDSKKVPFYKTASLWLWSELPHKDTTPRAVTPKTLKKNFTCSANDSMEVIPPYLPPAHKEFLQYKHCREFPTLLTPSPCEDDLYLLLVIKSTAAQVQRRAALRDTWGHAGHIQGRRVKLVFLMGHSHDQVQSYKLQPLLQWESLRYRDILQWDFVDSFYNLTLKEVGFLSWFSHTCSSAQFVFKGDDDVFVHTGNLVEFLSIHNPDKHLFTGDILPHSFPIRNRATKYFIPVEMYPDGKPYPPYAGGGGYLMSRHTVIGLDMAAQSVELFPIDDVFVGMCLQQMGIRPTNHRGFLTFGFSHGFKQFDPCVYRDIMLVHKLNPMEMWVMWGLIMDDSLPCGRG